MRVPCQFLLCVAALGMSGAPSPAQEVRPPRNIVLMVADGGGESALEATRLYNGARLTADGPEWSRSWVATFALRTLNKPLPAPEGYAQDPALIYSPANAWGALPRDGDLKNYKLCFTGYAWLRMTAPDSANTMTALVTGVRTYPSAINVDGAGVPIESAAQVAHANRKRVGIITTVPWTHATPAAGGGAHHVSRSAYAQIGEELLSSGIIDVLGGAGHPLYSETGSKRDKPEFKYVGKETWERIERREPFGGANGRVWTIIDEPAQIESLSADNAPLPVLLQIRNGEALQQTRASKFGSAQTTAPGDDPLTEGTTTLESMTAAAMRVVSADPDGFFLMIEGGAVDWAEHANQCGRMIEEYQSFDRAVSRVQQTLDAGAGDDSRPNWSNTLVIVTADHDHLLLGAHADTIAFEPLNDHGKGAVPGHLWLSNSHTNRLVPLYARGAGAAELLARADEFDRAQVNGQERGRGAYLQQPEVGEVIKKFLSTPATAAAPTTPGARSQE